MCKGIIGDLFDWSPAIFCQKLHILALLRALVLLLQSEDFTAPLGGLLLLEGKGELKMQGRMQMETFPAHPDTEIGMCSLPPGVRECSAVFRWCF